MARLNPPSYIGPALVSSHDPCWYTQYHDHIDSPYFCFESGRQSAMPLPFRIYAPIIKKNPVYSEPLLTGGCLLLLLSSHSKVALNIIDSLFAVSDILTMFTYQAIWVFNAFGVRAGLLALLLLESSISPSMHSPSSVHVQCKQKYLFGYLHLRPGILVVSRY